MTVIFPLFCCCKHGEMTWFFLILIIYAGAGLEYKQKLDLDECRLGCEKLNATILKFETGSTYITADCWCEKNNTPIQAW